MNLHEIKVVAESIRKKMEKFARSCSSVGFDVHNADDLSSGCHIASVALKYALASRGIKSKLVSGNYGDLNEDFDKYHSENHCWIQIEDLIVDITATQFGIKSKVHITSTDDKDYTPHHYNSKVDWSEIPSQCASTDLIQSIIEV